MADNSALWYTAAFATFAYFIGKPVVAKIAAGLDRYADNIRGRIDEANTLLEQSQSLLAQYKRDQREQQADIDNIVARAKKEAFLFKTQALEKIENDVAHRRQLSINAIANAERQAIAALQAQAMDLSVQSVTTFLSQHPPEDVFDANLKDMQDRLAQHQEAA